MLLLLSVVILLITCNEASPLDIVCNWSNWKPLTDCKDGTQTLQRYCLCNGHVVPNTRLCPFEEDVILVECSTVLSQECQWTWSAWSHCSRPCGIQYPGNSTRIQNCMCDNQIVDASLCDSSGPETQTTLCNVYPCNSKKPSSAIEWLNENKWPISKNETFNCYRSSDSLKLSSRTWEQILSDSPYPNSTQWHYLAKEYITARLNHANGSMADDDVVLLEEAQFILGQCEGFSTKDSLRATELIATLNSLNSAVIPLGGVSQSDFSGRLDIKAGSSSKSLDNNSNSISVVLPVVALLVGLLVLVGFILFKKRMNAPKNQTVVKESFNSSEDSSQSNERDDRSAEELRL